MKYVYLMYTKFIEICKYKTIKRLMLIILLVTKAEEWHGTTAM